MFKKVIICLFIILAFARPAYADYSLPNPGLLPDSPFYIFKVIRDNITLNLISDPTQKSFYYLLLSDKRLKAADQLIKNKKTDLGITTIKISDQYLQKSINIAQKLPKNTRQDLASKIIVSTMLHEEIISKNNLFEEYRLNQVQKTQAANLLLN